VFACLANETTQAVCVSNKFVYSVVKLGSDHLIIAQERLKELGAKLKQTLEPLHTFTGDVLVGSTCAHPFDPKCESVVLDGSHVTLESGTGLVHTAPGHGHDDFFICKAQKIPAYCPVDDNGRYTAEVKEDKLQGKSVLDEGMRQLQCTLRLQQPYTHLLANPIVIEMLKSKDLILFQENYKHRYPYDWRTKKPIIIRATRQWFCDLTNIKKRAMQVIQDSVTIIPNSGRTRLNAMLQTRDDWCISRQRHWGVPIPVFYDVATDEHLMVRKLVTSLAYHLTPKKNDETIGHVQELFKQHGSDCWWTLSTEELLPTAYRNNGKTYRKGTDTMDVWFDSGISWAGVLKARGEPLPADVYLEGSDQHRGWFQSSLLTSGMPPPPHSPTFNIYSRCLVVAATEQAPYKTIVTHGFVLDEQFRKMSKSLGNVIAPSYVISGGKDKSKAPAYGVDVLRMWVASTDFSGDVSISDSAVGPYFNSP